VGKDWVSDGRAYAKSKTEEPHDRASRGGRLRLGRAARERPLTPGTLLGRYRISSLVGRGRSGDVYRANDVRRRRDVALKIPDWPPELQRDWALNEARIASSLNHPCICVIYDAGEENGMAYIAMEYIEGSPLSSLCCPSGLPPALAVGYGRLIASALSHSHEHGVIHRDLKSANVMITQDGQLKVLDFGLAKHVRVTGSQTSRRRPSSSLYPGRLVGTVHSMAPEVLRGDRSKVWSDIWSLGVLLYEMATGQLPFRGRTNIEMANAILGSDPVPPPEGTHPRLVSVIAGCLMKEPHRRYHTARDVLYALGAKGLPRRSRDMENLQEQFRKGHAAWGSRSAKS